MEAVLERTNLRRPLNGKRNGAPHPIRWSVDEYYKMYEQGMFEGRRVELIRGEIIEMSPMLSPHATAIQLLAEIFRELFGKNFVIRQQLPTDFGKYSEPEPDIAVVEGSIRDFADHHPTKPSLVVEVALMTIRFDQTKKLSLYAENGIEEYWILNLKSRELEVYRQPNGIGESATYLEKIIVPADGTLSPIAKPKAKLKVADMLP